MSKTITCLYQDQEKASAIVSRLEQAGISRGDISFYSTPSDDLIDDLENDGVPRTDAHAYAEGVRRGGSLVAVECDEDEVDRVIGILDDDGVVDLDEQQTSWRSEGWQGLRRLDLRQHHRWPWRHGRAGRQPHRIVRHNPDGYGRW